MIRDDVIAPDHDPCRRRYAAAGTSTARCSISPTTRTSGWSSCRSTTAPRAASPPTRRAPRSSRGCANGGHAAVVLRRPLVAGARFRRGGVEAAVSRAHLVASRGARVPGAAARAGAPPGAGDELAPAHAADQGRIHAAATASDAVHSSHDFGAPKEDAAFWRGLASKVAFDPARTAFLDDTLSGAASLARCRHRPSHRDHGPGLEPAAPRAAAGFRLGHWRRAARHLTPSPASV